MNAILPGSSDRSSRRVRASFPVAKPARAIVKLRVVAAENWAFANWAKEFTRLRSIAFRAQSIAVVDHTFFARYSIIINAVIFAAIGMFVAEGSGTRMSTGDFVAFSAAFSAFFVALVTLSETVLTLLNLLPIHGRARPILEELPEVDASKKHPGELQGSIEVVKLGFSYTGDQEILRTRASVCVRATSSLWSVHRAPASPPCFGSCSVSRGRAAARSTTTTRISQTSTCARCDGKPGSCCRAASS